MKYKFEISEIHNEGDLMVASGEGNNKEEVEREAQHYAMQYAQDYKIRIWRNYSHTVSKENQNE